MSIAMKLYGQTQSGYQVTGVEQYDLIQAAAKEHNPIITDGKHGEKVYTFADKSQFFLCDRGYERVVQVLLF